jgi:hypothetical protein
VSEIFGPTRSPDFHRNAVVEDFDEHAIAIGFADLADLGVEEWERHGPNDLLFVPIVYNYRHALELVLKAAIRETAACPREDGETDADLDRDALDRWLLGPRGNGHSLQRLAVRLDEWLRRLDLEGLPENAHDVLMSLHELDPRGDAFRYATVSDGGGGRKSAPRPGVSSEVLQSHVDVIVMQQHFRGAFDLLSAGVMTELENVQEYQADMRDMYGETDW